MGAWFGGFRCRGRTHPLTRSAQVLAAGPIIGTVCVGLAAVVLLITAWGPWPAVIAGAVLAGAFVVARLRRAHDETPLAVDITRAGTPALHGLIDEIAAASRGGDRRACG